MTHRCHVIGGMINQEEKVTAPELAKTFEPSMKWHLIEEYGAESFTELSDGKLLFEHEYADEEGLLSWMLSLRDKVTVIEPKSIREGLFRIAAELTEKYKEEVDEGLCVQIMHHGPFDDEPATVAIMDKFLEENGYRNDFTDGRLHQEIYMSDARKVAPEKWRTVIRHPICKKEV